MFYNRLEKIQQLRTFMKVPNMNHCSADAWRLFPVLLRAWWTGTGSWGGLSVSDGCTVVYGR